MFCTSLFEHYKHSLKNYEGNYLEIGVYNGDAIKNLAEIYPDKTIMGIDPFIEDGNTSWNSNVQIGGRLVEQRKNTYDNIAGHSNIKFHEMTSKKFLENLTPELVEEYDVCCIMIDGDHRYDAVMIDIELAIKLLGDKKGEISFDDTHVTNVLEATKKFENTMFDRIVEKKDLNSNAVIYILKGGS
jgi:hypothetical protein